MHPKSSATQSLVLAELPSGELAWLRPVAGADDPDPRYVLTEQAHDYLAREGAMQALFGEISL